MPDSVSPRRAPSATATPTLPGVAGVVAVLFLALELVSNTVIEPWLHGASTGLSPIAILASALLRTWVWGLPGLLLAVPLTVCASRWSAGNSRSSASST